MPFTITSQPYFDSYKKTYSNILLINQLPHGPLRKLVRRISLPKLSPFQKDHNLPSCGLAIINPGSRLDGCYSCNNSYNKNANSDLMTPDNIPFLYHFLLINGYQIESQLTNMMNQSDIKLTNSRIVCMVTYYGDTIPNITYMR